MGALNPLTALDELTCFAVMLVFSKRWVYLFLLLINCLPQLKKEHFMI